MLKQLQYTLSLPTFSDEDRNQLASFLQVILVSCFVLTLANILIRFFLTPNYLDGIGFNGIGLLVQLGCWQLLRRGHVFLIGNLLPAGLWLIVTYVVISSSNGVSDPSFISYAVIIVITGFIWGGRGALLMAGVTAAISLAFITPTSKLLWLNYNIVFALTAILLGIARHNVYRALNHAKQNARIVEEQNELLRCEVAEHQQAKTAQSVAEDKYRAIVENAVEGIFQSTPDGRLLSANPALARIYGYDSPASMMNAITDVEHQIYVDPKRRQEWKALLETNGEVRSFETQIYHKSGDVITVIDNTRAVRDEAGKILYYEGTLEDVTERKKVEAALRESEARYRKISEMISDYAYYYRIEPDGNMVREWITDSVTRVTGYTPAETAGGSLNTAALFHPEEMARVKQHQEMVRHGEIVSGEYCIITKWGEERWLNIDREPVWNDDKTRPIGYYGVARDITERKNAQDALQKSEERYRIIAESISDYAFSARVEPDGRLIQDWQSASFERMLGYSIEEINTHDLMSFYHPDDHEGVRDALEKILQGHSVEANYRLYNKANEMRWIHFYAEPVSDERGRVVRYYGVLQDITERKLAEEALRESETRYRIITEMISDYAYALRVDPDGTVKSDWVTEAAFARVTGYTHDEYREQGLAFSFHPDDRHIFRQEWESTLRGERTESEYRLIRKDGQIIWMHSYRYPIWDEEQKRVTQIYGVARDITEQKLAEARHLELAVAAERQRVEVLKGFLSAATHDLRTPLSIMFTSLHLLQRVPPEKQPRYINQLNDQTKHIQVVIENMFSLSRLDMAEEDFSFACWNLNDLIQEAAGQQQSLIEQKQHSLVVQLDTQDLIVVVDSTALEIALKHILINALNYTHSGGLIQIKSYQRDACAFVEVMDNGIGISMDDLPHIFERFYRVDKARQLDTGTSGLGLTIAQKIIQAHRGDIEVESVLGQGSTFRVRLPLAPKVM